MHPASTIEPGAVLTTNPPTFYGEGVFIDVTTGYIRAPVLGDQPTGVCYGVVYRPYPFQISSASNWGAQGFGTAPLPTAGEIDVLRSGYVLVPVNVGATPVKGQPVFLWVGPTAGNHIQGGFESAATAGQTLALDAKTTWMNNGADPFGVAEIGFNI
jgi:hypothetical protein